MNPARRRTPVGAVLGLTAFLFLAPMFMLPALALLLIVSGPATGREWGWIAVSALWLFLSSGRDLGLYQVTVLAAGIMIAGAFVALTLSRPRPTFQAALLALLIGVAGLLVWGLHYGIGWHDVQNEFVRRNWEFVNRVVIHPELEEGGLPASPVVQEYGERMAAAAQTIGGILPAITALTALAGLGTAWSWYRRIASRPYGEPMGALADFRFSDQLVWGLILGLALFVAPGIGPLHEVGVNLVLFFSGLFAIRGLAVIRTWLTQAPGALVFFMALSLIFIAPVALGGLLSLGLADIWLDFRRRLMPPTVEG